MVFNYQYTCCEETFNVYAPARMHVFARHFDWNTNLQKLYLCTDPECRRRNIGNNNLYETSRKHLKDHFQGLWQLKWDFEQRQINMANDQLRLPNLGTIRRLLDTFDNDMPPDEPFDD